MHLLQPWKLTAAFVLATASTGVLVGGVFCWSLAPRALQRPAPARPPGMVALLGGLALGGTVLLGRWYAHQVMRAWPQGSDRPNQDTQAALQESEVYYRNIVEDLSEVVCRAQPDTTLVFVNDAYCRFFGVQPQDVLGKPFLDFIHPDDQDRVRDLILTTSRERPTVTMENRVIVNQQIYWMQWIDRVSFDQQGNVTEIQSVGRDITPLKQSEALQRAILNAIPDLMIRMHRDGTYLDIKPTLSFPNQLPGLMVGQNVRNVLPPEHAQRRLATVETALQTGEIQIYEFAFPIDNQSRWQEVRIIPFNPDEVLVLLRDLTERRQVEQALRESEERFRQLAETVQAGFFVYEVESCHYSYVNPAYEAIFGNCQTGAQNPIHWLDQLHPDDRDRILLAFQGDRFDQEYRLLCGNGEMRWLRVQAFPICDPAGAIIRRVGTVEDITQRKQTEQNLQEREAMLRAIGDNLHKGFIYQRIYDPDKGFSYSYISAGVERLLGISPEEILKNPLITRSVGFADDLERADRAAQESLQTLTPIELQMRGRRPSGKIGWSSIRSVPRRLEDGRVVWDGLEVDITDLKQTEAALRESEEKFRRSFDDAPIGVSLILATGRYLRVNRRYCEMVGYCEAELLSISFQDITHPDDLVADLEGFRQIVEGQISTFQIEKRYVSRQGTPVPVLLNAAPIRDQDGQLLYVLGHVQDIRDRLKVERLKDEFISVISHELRTPLTSIRGALGLLESGIYKNKPEKAESMLRIAVSSSERLVHLVNDVLTLERLKSDQVPLVREPCPVDTLMQQALESVQAIADQTEITLAIAPLQTTLWVDPDAILQTLTNLLSNAIKFSAPGDTVWLTAALKTDPSSAALPEKTDSPWTEPAPTAPEPPVAGPTHICFSVKDQGRGIPSDKLEIIFEQFQQVDVSDTRKKQGTGLGLAICKRIVQQHNGKIWVESMLGEGSTFYFTLPLITKDNHDEVDSCYR